MRQLLTSLVLVSCLFPIGIGGLKLASSLSEPSRPHQFSDLTSEPLWSSDVRRVNPLQQAYERLPATISEDTLVAETSTTQGSSLSSSDDTKIDTFQDNIAAPKVNPLHVQAAARAQKWCSTRYRSYDPSDNTYQPYSGGSRRLCNPPVGILTAASEQEDPLAANGSVSHAQWCMERYSSYRIEDDTYQPFSGGRRKCTGPSSLSASNTTKALADASAVQF
ncbi:BA14K family protein [Neorhizobium alkalisoli]|uniref:Lectin-like protein BA14k n=1 Tax=Neorhizobium alkalisoli TaxID=528178 RepID=A0A561PYV6_9HYPH|nr:BA14K-like protein [Neorhizobium alkalisoli]